MISYKRIIMLQTIFLNKNLYKTKLTLSLYDELN